MHIYEGHMGGLYVSYKILDWEDTYCEQCGDHDWYIGEADTKEEAWDLLRDDINIDGSGGWDYNYIQEFINDNWNE